MAVDIIPPDALSAEETRLISAWSTLNRQVLVAYWAGEIGYTEDAIAALRPLS